jgi:hydroxyacylglutathione hydrolase
MKAPHRAALQLPASGRCDRRAQRSQPIRKTGLFASHVLLNTHGHADHIGGNLALKEAFVEAPLIIGASDEDMLTDAMANLSARIAMPIVGPPAARLIREGDMIDAVGIRIEVLDVPGHVIFVLREDPIVVFGGDVLFRESIGRYDFPGSDGRLVVSGIRNKLFALPDSTVVYPGHGPVTTIGHEKKSNPYVRSS